MAPTVRTPFTELAGIKYPIVLAGMAKVSNADLCAAVTNAHGLGCVGGVGYTPAQLRAIIADVKRQLHRPDAPFGVDLLLPQVGGSARKTNRDYARGQLPELIDIICEEKPRIFVSAVGVPPQWAVDKLHAAGILVANMVGHPKHCAKALGVGVDLIIAQGTEAGGHGGEIATSVLVPLCVDAVRGHRSPLHGGAVGVLAAGGIFDGRGVAMALALGAQGVWIGTRFIVARESGASTPHRKLVLEKGCGDTIRTTIYTGRPLRCVRNPHNADWEENRREELKALQEQGIVAYKHEVNAARDKGEAFDLAGTFPQFVGQAMGGISKEQSAAEIVEELMEGACRVLTENAKAVIVENAEGVNGVEASSRL